MAKISRTGTITYIPIGEGFYGIITNIDDSYRTLYPVGLSNEYQVDGLRVAVQATVCEEYYTTLPIDIVQWGVPVELDSISRVEDMPIAPIVPEAPWYKRPITWVGVGIGLLIGITLVSKRKRYGHSTK